MSGGVQVWLIVSITNLWLAVFKRELGGITETIWSYSSRYWSSLSWVRIRALVAARGCKEGIVARLWLKGAFEAVVGCTGYRFQDWGRCGLEKTKSMDGWSYYAGVEYGWIRQDPSSNPTSSGSWDVTMVYYNFQMLDFRWFIFISLFDIEPCWKYTVKENIIYWSIGGSYGAYRREIVAFMRRSAELPAFLTLRAVRNISRNYKRERKNSLLLNLNINFERCPHLYSVLESRRDGYLVIWLRFARAIILQLKDHFIQRH